MDLQGLGLGHASPAVIILGAGASRGASFTSRSPGRPQPPLDLDFFAQLERMPNRSAAHRRLVEFASREFGALGGRSMESVFSQLIASDQIARLPKNYPGRYVEKYRRARDDFLRVLVELFRETCAERECDFHTALVRTLRARDTVISFNYDCLIDRTLAQHATTYGRWDPSRSYGYGASGGTQFWGGAPSSLTQNPIRLLKPHGSLNWRLDGPVTTPDLHLRRDAYDGSAEGRIIPPLATKDIDPEPYRSVWAACRDALAATSCLVLVGYSAPDVDSLAQALLRLELASDQSRGLKALILVDPLRAVRLKIRELCGPLAVRPGRTTVHEFDTFREFAVALGAET